MRIGLLSQVYVRVSGEDDWGGGKPDVNQGGAKASSWHHPPFGRLVM